MITEEVVGLARALLAAGDLPPLAPDDPASVLAHQALAAADSEVMADVGTHNTQRRALRLGTGWDVGPSDAGGCVREAWYRNRPPADFEPSMEDTRAADAGTAMHAGITEARSALYPWRRYAMRIAVPGLDRDGEIDEYDPVTGEVHDWKTADRATWDYVNQHGEREHHRKQVVTYAFALAAAGHHVTTCKVTYIHRGTGEECTYDWDYNPHEAMLIVDDLMGMLTVLDMGVEPPRGRPGPTTDPLCQRCFARTHCWQGIKAAAAGRTPETYVRFGPDPKPHDPEVIWAVGQAGQARLARLAAEKAEDVAKALADVDAGTYGTWQVKRGLVRRPNWQTAHDLLVQRVAEVWDLPVDERPPLGALIAPPPVTRSRKHEIVPVTQKAEKPKRAKKRQPEPEPDSAQT